MTDQTIHYLSYQDEMPNEVIDEANILIKKISELFVEECASPAAGLSTLSYLLKFYEDRFDMKLIHKVTKINNDENPDYGPYN